MVIQTKSEETFRTLRDWLETPLGEALLQQEFRVVEEAFDGIFGEQCLQLGVWGEPNAFLRFARTQQSACIADIGGIGGIGGMAESGGSTRPGAIGHLYRLPVASDSVDAVLLPHALDYSDRPHAILREAQRVLRSDGHLVVLGFKPCGLWGFRRLIPGAGLPPGIDHLISDRQLSDWLQLLDFRIHGTSRYFFRSHSGELEPLLPGSGQRKK